MLWRCIFIGFRIWNSIKRSHWYSITSVVAFILLWFSHTVCVSNIVLFWFHSCPFSRIASWVLPNKWEGKKFHFIFQFELQSNLCRTATLEEWICGRLIEAGTTLTSLSCGHTLSLMSRNFHLPVSLLNDISSNIYRNFRFKFCSFGQNCDKDRWVFNTSKIHEKTPLGATQLWRRPLNWGSLLKEVQLTVNDCEQFWNFEK